MDYNFELNKNSKIITVRTTGHLKTTELAEMCVLIRKKAIDLNYKVIFDYSLSKNFISITEAYYWFSDYYDVVDLKLRQIPAAVITSKEDNDFFQFLETTCSNEGITLKVFLEELPAVQWLDQI